jgi:hypothetical protein
MNRRSDIAMPKLFVFDRAGAVVIYIPRYSPLTGRRLEAAVERMLADRRNADAGGTR